MAAFPKSRPIMDAVLESCLVMAAFPESRPVMAAVRPVMAVVPESRPVMAVVPESRPIMDTIPNDAVSALSTTADSALSSTEVVTLSNPPVAMLLNPLAATHTGPDICLRNRCCALCPACDDYGHSMRLGRTIAIASPELADSAAEPPEAVELILALESVPEYIPVPEPSPHLEFTPELAPFLESAPELSPVPEPTVEPPEMVAVFTSAPLKAWAPTYEVFVCPDVVMETVCESSVIPVSAIEAQKAMNI
ncbi:hypothetical protein M9458_015554 [Cirrhinus mrigala]|uniref:Uncharacterized protein n=1 Tax=Cirrhinus mrigala TaxID=683832 RepID=A0ABD0QRW1_CIRMR